MNIEVTNFGVNFTSISSSLILNACACTCRDHKIT